MEAATPLFSPTQVRILGDRILVDGLVVDDECAVRLARDHDDPARLLVDAIEIGARVLDREQTAADVEFVRAELAKVEAAFAERARGVTDAFGRKVDEALAPETGHLTRALERHFSDGSSTAVQHRVRAVIEEVMAKSREELRRQFAAEDASNPLAGFQRQSLAMIRTASEQQAMQLSGMAERIAALQAELAQLRGQQAAQAELDAERERGTAKGRSFEEAVVEALEELAAARGDVCEAVGDLRGAGGKKGDVVVSLDACAGPARGRIVFEAKDSQLPRKKALADLEAALEQRDADYAVFVVPAEDELPARTHPLQEYNGDKMFVTYDPEEGSRLALEVAYGLARARVLMGKADDGGLDLPSVRAEVERAENAMDEVRRIKSMLTQSANGIEQAKQVLDAMATGVRGHLKQLDALLAGGEDPGADG